MTKQVLFAVTFFTITLFTVALNAQTKEVLAPAATGVSDTFQNYSQQIQGAQQGPALGDEAEIPTPPPTSVWLLDAPIGTDVAAPPSSMLNQTSNGSLPVTISKNYTGLGDGFNGTWTDQGLLPPSPVIGVGLTQIVQWVNIRLTVLDKATGAPLLGGSGFINANQIWAGLGPSSLCAITNRGDPLVQYDRLAGRWVLSQFASSTIATAQCIAVSQTSDATGAYNLYEYDQSNYPDYTKLAVWPDAYYLTFDTFAYVEGALTMYTGSSVCAYDRAAMIAGTPASAVCFVSGTDGSQYRMLAADFEGTIPPAAGEAEFVLNGDWFSKNSPPYGLQLRRFHPDFVTPANSTLTDGLGGGAGSFVSLPFDSSVIGACGDMGGNCVPQPGTTRKLDTQSMQPMHRLAYRNLGANRETLVFTQSVDPLGAAVAGIQLIEIRNPAADPPAIYNNVNFNPDATNRWMGSAASDKLGNVALGYSVSSGTLYPGIRIAGRLRNDMRNFVRGEMNVQTGSGSQTSSVERWGDYNTMQIDPSDDCTFWYTNEYFVTTSSADWATRIIGFKFNNCN